MRCERRLLLPAMLALLCVACPSNDGSDGGSVERLPPKDSGGDVPPSKGVNFVAQGCLQAGDSCRGEAPLEVTFFALTTGVDNDGEWDFGDGAKPKKGPVVKHVYELPGTYTVTLTVGGGAGETFSEQKTDLIVVAPAGPGAACFEHVGCRSGDCGCRSGCPFPLGSQLCEGDEDRDGSAAADVDVGTDGGAATCRPIGTCLDSCVETACPAGTTCVDLSGPQEPPWRAKLCLPSCTRDVDCERPGFVCRLAPTPSGWRKACLPFFPNFIGAPCRDEQGEPDDALCLGGRCLDIGAGGYCSASCDSGRVCPEPSRCVRFAEGEKVGLGDPLCLLRCTSTVSCDDDPQLTCEPPGEQGLYGLEIVGLTDPPDTTYCSVKRCSKPAECGLSGQCTEGFCGARP